MIDGGVRLRAQTLAVALAIMLAACGGGGGGDSTPTPTPTPVTPVPETLAVTAPASAESAVDLQFGNSAASVSGLSFSWDFGDGKTSTEASPKHAFAKGGDYEVVLKVSNTAGASRETRAKVSITNLNNVKGLVCSGANDGGWCWQEPRPTGNGRAATYLLNATTAFTVGENGEIFKSTDAGATWTAQRSGTTATLRSITFTSPQDGWILGEFGALLRSSDGGATWALSKIPDTSNGYNSLQVMDAKTAFLDRSRYTVDGGKTWTTPAAAPTFISPKGTFWRMDSYSLLRKSTDFGLSYANVLDMRDASYSLNNSDLSVLDEKTAVVSASFYRYEPGTGSVYKSVMWRTTDGGASWTRSEPTGLGNGYGSFIHVLRADADDPVWIGYSSYSSNSLFRSLDAGKTWTAVTPFDGYYYSINYAESLVVGKTILMPASQTVLRSTDGGMTWARATVSSSESSYDSYIGLRQIEGDTFSMRDTQGRSYLSTDAGSTWKLAISTSTTSSSYQQSSLAFLNSKQGLLLSAKGELSETKDGGKSWAVKLPGLSTGSEFQLQFVNDKTGWMLLGDGRLYKTTDGAVSWGTGTTVRNYGLSYIGFVDENRGWGRVRYGSSGFVVTTDGGKTWADISAPNNTWGLHMISEQQIVAYGYYGMLALSADAGKTWVQPFVGTQSSLAKVTSSDSKTLWAVGTSGVLIRSGDAGVTWATVNLGTQDSFNDIAFADARNGWLVGARGTVFATTDGGKTWVRQATGTLRDLRKIMAVDSKTAWITGDYGMLLATGNGGF